MKLLTTSVAPSLNVILALAVAAQLAIGAPHASAKPKPDPTGNAWHSLTMLNEIYNFRFANGDIVSIKQKQMAPQMVGVQVRRKGETEPSGDNLQKLKGIISVAGPERLFHDMTPQISDFLKPQVLASSTGKVNLMYVRGKAGILVIGQITELSPASYFTYMIPASEMDSLPIAQLTYLLPDPKGLAAGMSKTAEIGIVMGFEGNRVVTNTITVPLDVMIAPATATLRKAGASDEAFLKIPFVNGDFSVPEELKSQVTSAGAVASSNNELTGIDKYRANSRVGDSLSIALKAKIFGQDAAVNKFVFHYRKTLTAPMTKPRVLMAMGPSGVGKTFTAEEFAKTVTGSSNSSHFMVIPGNEFNAHAESLQSDRLFGSPKGTKDAQEGSLITWVKKLNGELGVLLINEGDKMHPDNWLKMMELLDQGKLTANDGSVVKADKLIIIITSNRGATRMFPAAVAEWSQADIDKRLENLDDATLKSYWLAKDGLKDEKSLPREIINRINGYIPFGPFSREAAVHIARLASRDLVQEFQRDYLIHLKFDDLAIEKIALSNWTPADDARQIREQVSSAALDALDVAVHKLNVENGHTINVSYDTTDIRKPAYRVTVGALSATIDGVHAVSNNPLQNKELMQKLLDLEGKMKTQVIGQDGTISNIARAVISHAARAIKSRPLVLGLLGVSGNGKTETARALANARFDGHLSIISMGDISTTSDFDTKFGSGAQFQGGDITREFETALKSNPDGGVIVMDEISNMGGKNPELRAALLTKLYGIFEEGKFTSPIDGKVYDLGKYIFVLTGNESEELFANVTSDDMLKSIWEENRGPAKVRGQLTGAKYPPAFINRAKWFLMKPLLSYEVHTVTTKLWNREAEGFMKSNPGLKVTTGKNFFDRVTVAYFTPDKGGRALRDVFEDHLGYLLTRALHESGLETDDLRGVTAHFDLLDSHLTTPYVTRNSPPRAVAFKATIIKDGKAINSLVLDATDLAAEQSLLAKDSALAVSYHEMGHGAFEGLSPDMMKALGYGDARMSDLTGMQLQYVTIRGGRAGDVRYYGYARSAPIAGAMLNPTHDRVVVMIAELWAGSKAQQMAGYPIDAGWGNDLEKIRSISTNYFTKWGLDREFVGISVDKDGNPVGVPAAVAASFNAKRNALLLESEKLAEKVVRLRWDFIGSSAMELMRRGEISIERMHEIDAKVTALKQLGKRVPTPRRTPIAPPSHGAMTCEDLFK